MWSMTDQPNNGESHQFYEFEILKQRYESLEKTFTNVEKEKEYYQVGFTLLNQSDDYSSFLSLQENIRTNEKRFRTYRRKISQSKKINQRITRSVCLTVLFPSSLLNNSFQ